MQDDGIHPTAAAQPELLATVWPQAPTAAISSSRSSARRHGSRGQVWLQSYPPGVPAEINPDEYPLAAGCHRAGDRADAPDRPAFTCMDRTLTYRDLDRLGGQLAAYLQRVARLKKGDRLAVMLPERAPVPGRARRRVPRRADGRQHQPAVHPARAAPSAAGFRRAGDPDTRELRAHARGSRRGHAMSTTVIVTRARRSARLAKIGAGELRRAQRAPARARVFAAGRHPVRAGAATRASSRTSSP